MSKAGKKIMKKREREAMESRISSSLPPSILRPDYPKASRVTQTEDSGSSNGATPEKEDDTPSSTVTIKGVPVVFEPTLEDSEAIVIPPGTRLRDDGKGLESIVEGRTPEECTRVFESTPTGPSIYQEMMEANAGNLDALKGEKREAIIMDEGPIKSPWYDADGGKAPEPGTIRQELDMDYGKPAVEKVDLDKWIDDGGTVGVDPGAPEGDTSATVIVEKTRQVGRGLTMEDAIELGSVAGKSLREPSERVKRALNVSLAADDNGNFPSFVGNDCEYTEEEIKAKLRKAADETVFIAPGPEKTDGEEEAPELAEVHEGTAQGGGTEAGQRDEEASLHGSGDSGEDAEQLD